MLKNRNSPKINNSHLQKKHKIYITYYDVHGIQYILFFTHSAFRSLNEQFAHHLLHIPCYSAKQRVCLVNSFLADVFPSFIEIADNKFCVGFFWYNIKAETVGGCKKNVYRHTFIYLCARGFYPKNCFSSPLS